MKRPRTRIRPRPLTRRLYAPVLRRALRFPKTTLAINFLLIPAVIPLGALARTEFMPQLREGSIMYMPTGLPMMAVEQARDVLVKTRRHPARVPRGRSRSSARRENSNPRPILRPIEMFETTIVLKPRDWWPRTFHAAGTSKWPGMDQASPAPDLARKQVSSTQEELIASP